MAAGTAKAAGAKARVAVEKARAAAGRAKAEAATERVAAAKEKGAVVTGRRRVALGSVGAETGLEVVATETAAGLAVVEVVVAGAEGRAARCPAARWVGRGAGAVGEAAEALVPFRGQSDWPDRPVGTQTW